ncbi:hypothetical protein QBC36DRAFT_340682 [Triangularia setosa]|uniref:Uncharacterized protein n=1 Tax=Triangularia setosa TaxID=2587417 RepID=A0AAN6VYF9_9PEZI|nr:hypothetical protein QBC36DRAFT_340682 [Podospora setosa]
MACDMLHLFSHEQACADNSLVCALLREEIRGLITGLQQQSLSGCPLEDIGNFLVNILYLASELARSVIKGHYIREFTTGLAPFLARESDLRSTKYVDGKYEALKKIGNQIRELSKTAVSIWSNSPRIPASLRNHLHQPTTASTSPGLEAETPLPESTSLPFRENPSVSAEPTFAASSMATHYDPESWDSPGLESSTIHHQSSTASDDYDDNVDYTVITSLQELSSRGRGIGPYICPLGETCRKGGVESNGRMRLFKRNSDFKAHLEKHEKRFKCDLPGCPKPERGFARADQLERHKQKVVHNG